MIPVYFHQLSPGIVTKIKFHINKTTKKNCKLIIILEWVFQTNKHISVMSLIYRDVHQFIVHCPNTLSLSEKLFAKFVINNAAFRK